MSRAATPWPQSSRIVVAPDSTSSPEAGVSGWGAAGPQPRTVRRTDGSGSSAAKARDWQVTVGVSALRGAAGNR